MRLAFSLLLILLLCSCGDRSSLTEVTQDVNRRLPAMVDEETRLDAITAAGDSVLSYHFTLVNASLASADTASLRRALWPGLLSHIRVDPDMKKLREDSVVLRYFYNDKDGKALLSFIFTSTDYL